jgi:hypothetical protein
VVTQFSNHRPEALAVSAVARRVKGFLLEAAMFGLKLRDVVPKSVVFTGQSLSGRFGQVGWIGRRHVRLTAGYK